MMPAPSHLGPTQEPRSRVAAVAVPITVQRLVVSLDGSRLAEAVLPIAARLAEAFGATIALLHVIEQDAPFRIHGEPHLVTRLEAEAYLAQLARQLAAAGRLVEYHVHEVPVGNVARSIAAHAEEQRSDLVLLSTHGAGGIRDVLWGSIAQQVLQLSHRPTLLVRARANTEAVPGFTPRTIMVSLDGTAAGEAALPLARTLAHALDVHLRLVMVVPTLETIQGEQLPQATFLPSTTRVLLDAQGEQAAAYLEHLAASMRSTGVPAFAEVRRGSPVAELATGAAEHTDGLVVVATHGRAGLQAIWSPSVAARLLKRTHAPVLLVPIVEPDYRSAIPS
jgi:nucleotide-binding universal stress UspA family protein